MSNGEVKRWTILRVADDEFYLDDGERPDFEHSEIKVMRVEDHERIVAELNTALSYKQKQVNEYWAELEDLRNNDPKELRESVSKQAQVIEKARQLYVNAVALIDKLSPGGEYTMDDVLARYDKELEDAASR